MTTLAACLASSSTIALPIPLLPPVTMATFPFRLMTVLPIEWVTAHSAAPERGGLAPDDQEGQGRHDQRHCGRPADDAVQTQPDLLAQRSHAESRDAVAQLVKRDQTARHRCGDRGQGLLPEADGKRQERRNSSSPARASSSRTARAAES